MSGFVETCRSICHGCTGWQNCLLILGLSFFVRQFASAQDPFSEGVRTTPALSPLEQQAAFITPDNLAIDLIAAEPAIQKPLNIAFDVRGRLWVTCTIEYPYPAKDGQGRDQIVILEDTNRDGHFDKHTIFADNLNIPIGILPLGDECIVFDIPYIWRMSDTDGDGVCDQRQRLLGPFDCTRDTHGMNNSFIQGFDGWIYACHGFANRSKVAGADGHVVTMNSGNVYRFLPDGSRIEHFSHGQVNPYGMTCDDWFALFTADCHSKPLTQVLRGAYYPSFGAPHDGLGFAPSMMEHFHGSTAIAGVEVLAAKNFPVEYQGQIVSGNVMTSRVNRNRLDWNGAYVQAIELPDLVATTDPWFRPVNLIQGPDGGVYIADFYNRIIGHYEVPLEHPGRDRDSGRIWRLRAAEVEPKSLGAEAFTCTGTSTLDELWTGLAHPVVRTRLSVLNEIVQRVASGSLDREAVVQRCRVALQESSAEALQVASLWCWLRVAPESIDAATLETIQRQANPVVRGHVQRVLAEALPLGAMLDTSENAQQENKGLRFGRGPELPISVGDFNRLLGHGLQDSHPRVVQLAVDAAGRNIDSGNLDALVTLAGAGQERDPVVVHSAKIALKRILGGSGSRAEDRVWVQIAERQAACWDWIRLSAVAQEQRQTLAEVMLAVSSVSAAEFLLDYLATGQPRTDLVPLMIEHIAKFLPAARSAELVNLIRTTSSSDLTVQRELLVSIAEGLVRSGQPTPPAVQTWAEEFVASAIADIITRPIAWESVRLDGQGSPNANEEAWQVQVRPILADSSVADHTSGPVRNVPMLSSLPAGETRTGILRSAEFALPEQLRFAIAGHRGFPDQAAHQWNQVRLRLESGEVIQTAFPPRHDIGRWVEWDLRPWAGQLATLEIQDGDVGGAYAWLAVGEFDPPVLTVPAWAPSQLSAAVQTVCQIASRFRVTNSADDFRTVLHQRGLTADDRLLVAQTVADLQGSGFGRAFAGSLIGEDLHPEIKSVCAMGVASSFAPTFLDDPPADRHGNPAMYLREWISELNARQQKLLVRAALNEAPVFERVLKWAETGHLAANSFNDASIQQQIKLADPGSWTQRVEKLLANLPPTDVTWRKRVDDSNTKFKPWLEELRRMGTLNKAELPRDSDLAKEVLQDNDRAEWKNLGQQIFKRDCSACHQLAGQGSVVGPHLDGINRRGLERVLEDILLPNQNVDHAFLSQLFLLENGQVVVGLVKNEDAVSVQLVDQQGKNLTLSLEQIEERKVSAQSLMPADIAHAYSDTTLFSLVFFLLEQ